MFLPTEIFSKRRKIYSWIEEKPELIIILKMVVFISVLAPFIQVGLCNFISIEIDLVTNYCDTDQVYLNLILFT